MDVLAFALYLCFVCSWFLHLTARIPVLGALRLDFWVAAAIAALMVPGLAGRSPRDASDRSALPAILAILIVYTIVAVPFVEWPGTVLRTGLPLFMKSVVFFYFTTILVTTRRRLAYLIAAFVACQTFRVLEPVYLHLTTGYWGSAAFMEGNDFLDRLSGSPFDIINPNGLAFVILTVLPFLHYVAPLTRAGRAAYVVLLPVLLYALALTGSRSGALAFLVVLAIMWITSRRKTLMAAVALSAAVVCIPYFSANLADRYMSIVSASTRNSATASGRISGELSAFAIASRRPFVGHGLGTSREANVHFAGADLPAHILYGEVAQELGYVGLAIFLAFVAAIFTGVSRTGRALRTGSAVDPLHLQVWRGLRVWLWMNLVFSFASYGLSEYEWYFAAGLSEVLRRATAAAAIAPPPLDPVRTR